MRKPALLAIVVALIAVVVVVAIVVSDDDDDSGGTPATLRLLSQSTMKEATDDAISRFEEENPEIDIRATYTASGTETSSLLLTQINAGNPPDIIIATPGNNVAAAVGRLAPDGRLTDLSDSSWVDDVPEEQRELLSHDGTLYGYPVSSYYFGMEYSNTIFEDAGVQPPTTMNELLALCRTLRENDETPIGLGLADSAQASTALWSIIGQYVYSPVPDWNERRERGDVRFATSPEWRRVFTTMDRMRDADCFSRGVTGETLQSSIGALRSGRRAMLMFTNVIMAADRAAAEGQDIRFFAVPGETAEQTKALVNVVGYGVTSEDQVEQSKRFIDFLAENNERFNEVSGGISNQAVKDGNLPEGNEALRRTLELGGQLTTSYRGWPNPAMFLYIGEQLQAWFTGQSNITNILEGMDYLWDNPRATTPR